MSESTKPTLNEAENGNKSKPLLSSRLFKFRAWCPSLQEIVNVTDLHLDEGMIGFESKENKDVWNSENFILMQFTGITDKNGKEIFEGDIINKNFEKYEVLFNNCEWVFTKINDYYKEQFYKLCFFDNVNFEVIGNVFENPELL